MTAKWKTFPCEECLLKSICKIQCFKFPRYQQVERHIKKKKYEYMCLSCGVQEIGPVSGYPNGCRSDCNHCTRRTIYRHRFDL